MSKDVVSYNPLEAPAGTPLGLGFLGIARFKALKLILDHATEQMKAATIYRRATTEYMAADDAMIRAYINRRHTQEELRRVDSSCAEIANRIEIARLRSDLERLELEEQLEAKFSSRSSRGAHRQGVESLLRNLQQLPEIASAATSVREQIVEDAGGEENLSVGAQNMIDIIDGIVTAFANDQLGDSLR
jgi:hypothetical protein